MILDILNTYLEHVLPENFLILTSEPLVNNSTELREVYETIPSNLISKIYYLLAPTTQLWADSALIPVQNRIN